MTRWFASRWLVLTFVAMVGAFVLAWRFEDPATFAGVAMAGIGMGQVHNTFAKHHNRGGLGQDTPTPEEK